MNLTLVTVADPTYALVKLRLSAEKVGALVCLQLFETLTLRQTIRRRLTLLPLLRRHLLRTWATPVRLCLFESAATAPHGSSSVA